jgi:hypothetical protein
MDQKSIIKTLEILDNRTEKIQEDIVQIRIDQASNKEVSELKSKMAAMEVKVYVFFGFMILVLSAIVGYAFKTNG